MVTGLPSERRGGAFSFSFLLRFVSLLPESAVWAGLQLFHLATSPCPLFCVGFGHLAGFGLYGSFLVFPLRRER